MTNLYPAHFNQFAIWKKFAISKKFGRSLIPKVHYWGMAVEEISNKSLDWFCLQLEKEEEQEELFLQQLDEIMQEENNCVHLRHDETIQVEPQSSSVSDKPTFCPFANGFVGFPFS